MASFSGTFDPASFLITDSELDNIYERDLVTNEITVPALFSEAGGLAIKTKVDSYNPIINHEIDCGDFDTIFVTSDLHSDLRKFIHILKENNIIETPINPYKSGHNIYDAKLITETRWKAGSRVLLIIIGDIVDGKRSGTTRPLDDTYGSLEYLLHCFLYNIRLRAKQENSEVLFTMGNHDVATVIMPSDNLSVYKNYVTDDAKRFFNGTFLGRRNALLPFYHKSPFLYLSLVNQGNPEIVFVHAGIRMEKNPTINTLPSLTNYQTQINQNVSDMTTIIERNYSDGIYNSLWDRYYTTNVDCKMIENDPLVIVGHCVTFMQDSGPQGTRYLNKKMSEPVYDGCDKGITCDKDRGCIVLGCNEHSGNPKFILVDTGMASGFRYPRSSYQPSGACKNMPFIGNKDRPSEILKLTRNPAITTGLYYNVIERQINGAAYDFSGPLNIASPVAPSPSPVAPSPSPVAPSPSPVAPSPSPVVPGGTRGKNKSKKMKSSKKRKQSKKKTKRYTRKQC